MYGQMTAGSWIYIGTQGILQGTYETFAECARQHFGGTLAGRLVVTGGLGGMGGAQPLAATMNGAAFLGVDVDESRIRAPGGDRLLRSDRAPTSTRRSGLVDEARRARRPLSVGLVGNIAEVLPELVRRGVVPDVVTDQTSAHDLRLGYIPAGCTLDAGGRAPRARSRRATRRGCSTRWSRTSRAMLDAQGAGRGRLRLRQQPPRARWPTTAGMARGVRHPGLRARVHPAAVLPGRGAVPLGGALRRSGRHRRDRPRRAGDVSRRTSRWRAGSGRRSERGRSSRGCPRASAGWSTASARRWGCASTGWCSTARSRRRS